MELVEHCSARGDGLAAPPARPLTGTARIIVALDRAIYCVAICWLLLPWLEQGFVGIRLQIERLFAHLVAEGRARPLA